MNTESLGRFYSSVAQLVGQDPKVSRRAVFIGPWLHGQFFFFLSDFKIYKFTKRWGIYFAGNTI